MGKVSLSEFFAVPYDNVFAVFFYDIGDAFEIRGNRIIGSDAEFPGFPEFLSIFNDDILIIPDDDIREAFSVGSISWSGSFCNFFPVSHNQVFSIFFHDIGKAFSVGRIGR